MSENPINPVECENCQTRGYDEDNNDCTKCNMTGWLTTRITVTDPDLLATLQTYYDDQGAQDPTSEYLEIDPNSTEELTALLDPLGVEYTVTNNGNTVRFRRGDLPLAEPW